MQDIAREMSFDNFALVHHVDLRPIGTMTDHVVTDEFMVLSDYPQFWVDQYIGGQTVANDPVLLATHRTNVGFAWDEIPDLIEFDLRHRGILDQGRKAGIGNGYTVPANIPGELFGSCNFAVSPDHDIPRQNFPMALAVGAFAFQAGRELVARMRSVAQTQAVNLTDRQLECIVLYARGKTDWEIGKILGIGQDTVKKHLADSRRRYDVVKSIQVVTRALFEGKIALSDIVK